MLARQVLEQLADGRDAERLEPARGGAARIDRRGQQARTGRRAQLGAP
jgi:hypothetical protein